MGIQYRRLRFGVGTVGRWNDDGRQLGGTRGEDRLGVRHDNKKDGSEAKPVA